MVLTPHAVDPLPIPAVKIALSFHHILLECALENLTVGKFQLSFPVFQVLREVS